MPTQTIRPQKLLNSRSSCSQRRTADVLHLIFQHTACPTARQRDRIARLLHVPERHITHWFASQRDRVAAIRDEGVVLSEGQVVPGMAMEAFTSCEQPFDILWASHDWLTFCGFSSTEVVGQPLKVPQGPETNAHTMATLLDSVTRNQSAKASITSYTKHGISFRHLVDVQPLVNTAGEPTLFKVRSSQIELLLERGVLLPTMSSIAALNELSASQ